MTTSSSGAPWCLLFAADASEGACAAAASRAPLRAKVISFHSFGYMFVATTSKNQARHPPLLSHDALSPPVTRHMMLAEASMLNAYILSPRFHVQRIHFVPALIVCRCLSLTLRRRTMSSRR